MGARRGEGAENVPPVHQFTQRQVFRESGGATAVVAPRSVKVSASQVSGRLCVCELKMHRGGSAARAVNYLTRVWSRGGGGGRDVGSSDAR